MKDKIERELLTRLREVFGGQLEHILKLLGDPPDLSKLPPDFWQGISAQTAAEIRPILEKGARQAAERMMVTGAIGVDWGLVAEDAARWASQYTYDLVTGLTNTTRRVLQEKVEQFIREPGRTIGDLMADLEPYFGKMRAQMIAVTETTRAFAEGERVAVVQAQKYGFRMEAVWHTNRDELVCSICEPADGKPEAEWGLATGPPAHPRCRCWITHRSVELAEERPEYEPRLEELRRIPELATRTELQDWASSALTAQVDDLKGVQLTYARDVLDSLYGIEQRVRKPLAIGLHWGGTSRGAYASYEWTNHEIYVKKRGVLAQIVERMRADDSIWQKRYRTETPYHSVATFEGMIYHEYAHAIDDALGGQPHDLIRGLSLEDRQSILKVSGYSGEGMFFGDRKCAEAFAESFVAIALRGPTRQYVPRAVRELIEGLLR